MIGHRFPHKSPGQIWTEDREVLKQAGLCLQESTSPLPLHEDYLLVFATADPAAETVPFLLTQGSLDELVVRLVPEIEAVFGDSFVPLPPVVLVPFHTYAARYRAVAVSLTLQLDGTYDPDQDILPPISSFPHDDRILVPQHVPLYDECNNPLAPAHWTIPMLEHALSTALLNMLFHYSRGEYKDTFIRARSVLSNDQFDEICAVKEAVTLHILDSLLSRSCGRWGVYHVADKMNTIYDNPALHTAYVAVAGLSRHYSFAQIAQFDSLVLRDYSAADKTIHCSGLFFENHPLHDKKYQRFTQATC